MPAGTARQTHYQLMHYFRKSISFNTPAIAGGVLFGTMPAGAIIGLAFARVNTAFNAATTNVLNVGTTATGGEIIPTGTFTATTGVKDATAAARAVVFAADTDLFVSYTQSGTAATTGQADVVIGFIPNNDQ